MPAVWFRRRLEVPFCFPALTRSFRLTGGKIRLEDRLLIEIRRLFHKNIN